MKQRHACVRKGGYELDCHHLSALGVPCTHQGTIMSYDFTQTRRRGGALVRREGRTWTATARSSTNEVPSTPDTPIVLPPEQRASPILNDGFVSFKVKLENLEDTSGATGDDTATKVEVVAGFSTVISNGHAAAECDHGRSVGVAPVDRRVHLSDLPEGRPGTVQTLAYALRDVGAHLLFRLAFACLQDGPPVSGGREEFR